MPAFFNANFIMTNQSPVYRIRHLCFTYRETQKVIFDDAELSVAADDAIGLWADNGSGKTTLLRLMTGLMRPDRGEFTFLDEPLTDEASFARVRPRVGYVLQNAEDQLFFPEVLEDVMFGPLNLGASPEVARERALESLRLLHIESLAHAQNHRLSGGQKRLVSIASILAMRPAMLLLDEPTTGLDVKATAMLTDVLNHLSVPRIVVSHHRDFLDRVSRRIVGIEKGRLIEQPAPFGV